MPITRRVAFVQPVLLAMCLAACGGGVDPTFAGAWAGTAILTVPGVGTTTTPATFVLSVNDGDLLVPSCEGRNIRVHGDGRHAHWTGQEVCRAPTASCSTSTITTLEFEADLTSDSRIHTRGVNRTDGCGVTGQLLGSFDGVRQ